MSFSERRPRLCNAALIADVTAATHVGKSAARTMIGLEQRLDGADDTLRIQLYIIPRAMHVSENS